MALQDIIILIKILVPWTLINNLKTVPPDVIKALLWGCILNNIVLWCTSVPFTALKARYMTGATPKLLLLQCSYNIRPKWSMPRDPILHTNGIPMDTLDCIGTRWKTLYFTNGSAWYTLYCTNWKLLNRVYCIYRYLNERGMGTSCVLSIPKYHDLKIKITNQDTSFNPIQLYIYTNNAFVGLYVYKLSACYVYSVQKMFSP